MSKYEVTYPNTVKYDPQIKNVVIEIFGKDYKVRCGVRNLIRVNKMINELERDPEILDKIYDLLFYKGFCDEIEEIEPNFPFDDFIGFVMDKIDEATPEALKQDAVETDDETGEPKKG